jgi:hypothetical protein
MLKNTLVLTLLILFTACGTHSKISPQAKALVEQQSIQNKVDSFPLIVKLPEFWSPRLDSHFYLCYSSENLGDIFYRNMIHIYQLESVKDSLTLINRAKSFAYHFNSKHVEPIGEKPEKELQSIESKYGKSYIFKLVPDIDDQAIDYCVLFELDQFVYELQYTSHPKYFDLYFPDVNYIFNHLELRSLQ